MKNILLIGAGSGIGLRIAQLLAPESSLYIATRSMNAELEALEVPVQLLTIGAAPVTGTLEVPEMLHGLVYCPGSINQKPFLRLTPQDFIADFEQNVVGAVNVIHAALPAMKKADGASIVLFSTVAAKRGMPFHGTVAASKSAVEGLAKSLAAEYSSAKIRVNVVAPSLTDTDLAANLLSTDDKRAAGAKRHPLQRVGTPDDSAQMVRFLLSDASSWMTGNVIGVDGGLGNLWA